MLLKISLPFLLIRYFALRNTSALLSDLSFLSLTTSAAFTLKHEVIIPRVFKVGTVFF